MSFDKGAELAWILDSPGGYREPGCSEWSLTPLDVTTDRLPTGRRTPGLSLRDVLPLDPGRIPNLTIEPTKSGMVRFRASIRLVVHSYGEGLPQVRGREVELPYGSVVRAGPLLVAPLYAVQARSLEQGRIALPRIGPDSGSSEEGEPGEHLAGEYTRVITSGRWRALGLAAVILLALSLVGGALGWRMANPPPLSNRVLVLLSFPPDAPGGALWYEADRELRGGGLEPVYLNSLMVPPSSCCQEEGRERSISDCARQLRAAKVMVIGAETDDTGEFRPTYGLLRERGAQSPTSE